MEVKDKLYLIDGHSLIYKAFYAIKPLINSKGEQTNAIYGFTSMILKLLLEKDPHFLLVVFDSKTPTFRHKIFEDYKAHRRKMPLELREQIPKIMEILKSLGIKYYQEDGYEADDVMSSIAKKYYHDFQEIILLANDKDILQLVDEKIKVYAAKKGISEIVIYDKDKVAERYKVTPSQIRDILSLMGDSSDNIPGIPGIGEKTAIKLIQEYKNLENLKENIENITPLSLKEKIKSNIKLAEVSKELVTLETKVPIKLKFSDLKKREVNISRVREIFKELEFYRFLERFKEDRKEVYLYKEIKDTSKLKSLIKEIERDKECSLAIISSNSNPLKAKILGICLGVKKEDIYIVSLESEIDEKLSIIKNLFQDEDIVKYGHNLKETFLVLKRYGIKFKNFFDLMIASYLLRPSISKHSLENLANFYLNKEISTFRQLLEMEKEILSIELNEIKERISQELRVIMELREILIEKIRKESLINLFNDIETPLIEVLADMEYTGIKIDTLFLKEFSQILRDKLEELSKDIYSLSEEEFNINSAKQLSYILFEKLKLPILKKIKSGYSTEEKVLVKLCRYHKLPFYILRYREISKLLSTYVEALPKLLNKETGRLHTSFNQTGTQTGRLSSSNPNLQNIPIKTELGRRIRHAFVPEKGYLFLSADYSQIELRILAHLSKDEELVKAFKEDKDIHSQCASNIFNLPIEEINEEMRRYAKTINFGIIYGMSAFGLSKELDITPSKAQSYIEAYFSKYSKIKEYIDETIEKATLNGYVTTIWGRKRYLPELNSPYKQIKEQAIRICINTPIQGSAADIIKLAMIKLYKRLKKENLKSRILLQIHDELLLEVLKEELSFMSKMVKEIMENVANLLVPLRVNLKIGEDGYEVL